MTARFSLAYRPPYDWDALLAFLAARATPGVECVDEGAYRRTITLDGKHGVIRVSHADNSNTLALEVRFADRRRLPMIVERVTRLFDLGADPSVIAGHLGGDPLLRACLRRHPGIRTPGAWDDFELAVRAIVGQQISVRGATTIAGRIASMFGSAVSIDDRLTHLFPTAAQLATAPIEEAGVIRARANAIRALAGSVVAGTLQYGVTALTLIPGIGDWTANYIAMRALGDPDAFPSGDVVLRRMAGGLGARELDRRAEAWRPWRAYAVMLLWQSATDVQATGKFTSPVAGSRRAASARDRR